MFRLQRAQVLSKGRVDSIPILYGLPTESSRRLVGALRAPRERAMINEELFLPVAEDEIARLVDRRRVV